MNIYQRIKENSISMMKARRTWPNPTKSTPEKHKVNDAKWKKYDLKEKLRAKKKGLSPSQFRTDAEAKFMKSKGGPNKK